MGVNKVVYGDKTLIDLTNDTVTADTLANGVIAHGADGEQIVGIMMSSSNSTTLEAIDDCNSFITVGYAKTVQNRTLNLPELVIGTLGEWGVIGCFCENTEYGTGTQIFFPVNGTYAGRMFTRHILDMNTDEPLPGDWHLTAEISDIPTEDDINSLIDAKLGVIENGTY